MSQTTALNNINLHFALIFFTNFFAFYNQVVWSELSFVHWMECIDKTKMMFTK